MRVNIHINSLIREILFFVKHVNQSSVESVDVCFTRLNFIHTHQDDIVVKKDDHY